MSRFENTVYMYWWDHEPFGPWKGCVICDGDVDYKEPCTCTDTEKCVGCQLGYQPCQDPVGPGCVVPNTN